MGILKSVSGFVVYSADGSLDVDTTVNNIKAAVLSEIEHSAIRDQEIEAVLNDVYERLGVDTCAAPTVINMAAVSMIGTDFSKMAEVANEIRDYLSRSTAFVSQRGRNGGLKRVNK